MVGIVCVPQAFFWGDASPCPPYNRRSWSLDKLMDGRLMLGRFQPMAYLQIIAKMGPGYIYSTAAEIFVRQACPNPFILWSFVFSFRYFLPSNGEDWGRSVQGPLNTPLVSAAARMTGSGIFVGRSRSIMHGRRAWGRSAGWRNLQSQGCLRYAASAAAATPVVLPSCARQLHHYSVITHPWFQLA